MPIWKRLPCAALLLLCATGLARASDVVHVGIINSLSDAMLFLGDERGYFRDQGITLDIVVMDSAGKMIAPLGSGELDVGGGAASAGLFNAVERGIQLRIVSDRTTTSAQSPYQTLMVRTSLVENGRYRALSDLKGLKLAIAAPGISVLSVANEAARAGGIAYADIEKVYLPFPQQLVAFSSGAIDASIMIEPYGTMAANAGTAVAMTNTDSFYPSDQVGLMFYSEDFATRRADIARRFMVAQLHAMRDYIDASRGPHLSGPGADAVIDVLARHFAIPPELARQVAPQHLDPDGKVNMASIRKDWEFFRAQGLIKGSVPPERVVDMSFATAAAKALGPYQPK